MSLRFGVKNLRALCNSVSLRKWNLSQLRQQSAVASPPRNPLKTWELFVYGGGMAMGVLYLPIYTMYHIRDYAGTRNPPEDE